MIISIKSIKRY